MRMRGRRGLLRPVLAVLLASSLSLIGSLSSEASGFAGVEGQAGLKAEPHPEGVLTNPAKEAQISIKVWLDKEVYHLGERLRVHFIISRDCYVYIYDISPQGKVTLLFPNVFEQANYLKAGYHVLPGPKQPYSLVTGGQPGIEYLQAIAASKPIPALMFPSSAHGEATAGPFPVISTEPGKLASTVKAQLEEGVSPSEWGADWTSFWLLERGHSRLMIASQPTAAEVYLNGRFAGLTPLWADLEPGFVKIEVCKAGYVTWEERIYLEENEIERIEAHLSPQVPLSPEPKPKPELGFIGSESEGEGGLKLELPTETELGIGDLPALGLNIGVDWESLGVELGLLERLRVGVALRFTGDAVPDYYEVGPPSQPWPKERVYNDGPEGELYLKFIIPVSNPYLEGLALELGAGLAAQEKVHIALPPSPSSAVSSQDIELKPNGYRTSETYATALGGVMVRLEVVFLELGYHSRRGLLLGVGIDL